MTKKMNNSYNLNKLFGPIGSVVEVIIFLWV